MLDLMAPIYLGTADNAVQDAAADQRINFEITVLTLLGYRTVIGTPFIWQSPSTLQAVKSRRQLFEIGDQGPRLAGRPSVHTAAEYFAEREADTRLFENLSLRPASRFRNEKPGASPLDWRKVVAPSFRVEARPHSVETAFRGLLVNDTEALSDKASICGETHLAFGSRFSKRARTRAESTMLKLAEHAFAGHFSRAVVENVLLIDEMPTASLDAALLRTTALYQAANGIAHNGILFTTKKLKQRMPSTLQLPVVHAQTIHPTNPYLFTAVLAGLGVRPASWGNLSSTAIVMMTSTPNPLRAFGELYKVVLIEYMFRWHKNSVAPTFHDAVLQLQNTLFKKDEWRILEPIAQLSHRKLDPFLIGALAGGGAALFGIEPISVAHMAHGLAGFGYKTIESLDFLSVLRMRISLRRYLEEVGLL